MHIVGYDTSNGLMDEGCTYAWLAGLLDMGLDEAREHKASDLAKSAGEVDFFPVYATDLACMLCEFDEDHADDGSECSGEVCCQCDQDL